MRLLIGVLILLLSACGSAREKNCFMYASAAEVQFSDGVRRKAEVFYCVRGENAFYVFESLTTPQYVRVSDAFLHEERFMP